MNKKISEKEIESVLEHIEKERLKKEWRSVLQDNKNQIPLKKNRLFLSPKLAIAASVLVLAAAIILWLAFPSDNIQRLADNAWSETPTPVYLNPNTKGDPNPKKRIPELDTMENGINAFESGNTEEAIDFFEDCLEMEILRQKYEDDLLWFLSLALLKNEQVEEAKTYLNQIIEQKYPKERAASELLERLGD